MKKPKTSTRERLIIRLPIIFGISVFTILVSQSILILATIGLILNIQIISFLGFSFRIDPLFALSPFVCLIFWFAIFSWISEGMKRFIIPETISLKAEQLTIEFRQMRVIAVVNVHRIERWVKKPVDFIIRNILMIFPLAYLPFFLILLFGLFVTEKSLVIFASTFYTYSWLTILIVIFYSIPLIMDIKTKLLSLWYALDFIPMLKEQEERLTPSFNYFLIKGMYRQNENILVRQTLDSLESFVTEQFPTLNVDLSRQLSTLIIALKFEDERDQAHSILLSFQDLVNSGIRREISDVQLCEKLINECLLIKDELPHSWQLSKGLTLKIEKARRTTTTIRGILTFLSATFLSALISIVLDILLKG